MSKLQDIPRELIDQYNANHEKMVDYVMKALTENDWNLQKTDGNFTLYFRDVPDSKFIQTKTVISLPVPSEAMIDVYTYGKVYTLETCPQGPIPPQEIYAIYDPKDEHQSVLYFMAMESPAIMVAPREFLLYRRTYFHEGGKQVFAQMSIENESIKPLRKDFVRGTIMAQAFIMESDPEDANKMIMTVFSHVNPGGKLPAWAVNFSVKNQLDGLKFVADKAVEYWNDRK